WPPCENRPRHRGLAARPTAKTLQSHQQALGRWRLAKRWSWHALRGSKDGVGDRLAAGPTKPSGDACYLLRAGCDNLAARHQKTGNLVFFRLFTIVVPPRLVRCNRIKRPPLA